MKFNSNSVLMHGGQELKLDVFIPKALMDIDISDEMWQLSIKNFNKLLNSRENVTAEINGINVDVIKVEAVTEESMELGAIMLVIFMKESEYEKIANTMFKIRGHLLFKPMSDVVDELIIENICWDNGKLL